MADISKYLQAINEAVYGEQVRGSIHDAIQAVNESAEGSALSASQSADSSRISAEKAEQYDTAAQTAANNAGKSAQAANLAERKSAEHEANTAASEAATGQSAQASAENAAAAKASEEAAQKSEMASKVSEMAAAASKEAAAEHAEAASISAEQASDSETSAASSANDAEAQALMSKSYAVGTEGVARTGDMEDNAKAYSALAEVLTKEAQKLLEQAQKVIAAASTGALIPAGTVAFGDLPASPQVGYMYNISDDFETDDRFAEGAGVFYRAGVNVYWTMDGQWDVLTGAHVTGIKGAAEIIYRVGDVNITPENIGASTFNGVIGQIDSGIVSEALSKYGVTKDDTAFGVWNKLPGLSFALINSNQQNNVFGNSLPIAKGCLLLFKEYRRGWMEFHQYDEPGTVYHANILDGMISDWTSDNILPGVTGISGDLEFADSGTNYRGIRGTVGNNDAWRVGGGATATNAGFLEIATDDDGNEPIYARQYSGGGTGSFKTLQAQATLLDENHNTTFPGTVTAPAFSGIATHASALCNGSDIRNRVSVRCFNEGSNTNQGAIFLQEDLANTVVNIGIDGLGPIGVNLARVATRAMGDENNNNIANTYATKAELNTAKANFQDGCNKIASAVTAMGINTPQGSTPQTIANNISLLGSTYGYWYGAMRFLSGDGASGWGAKDVEKIYLLPVGKKLNITKYRSASYRALNGKSFSPSTNLVVKNNAGYKEINLEDYGFRNMTSIIESYDLDFASYSGQIRVSIQTNAPGLLLGCMGYRESDAVNWDVEYYLIISY